MEKKILIVDDEEMLCEALSDFFFDEGWLTDTAKNGKEALIKINLFQPTVIISDINMPNMDGLEMLETLKQSELDTPVILLTGYRDAKKMQKAWACSAFDFLDKPVDHEALLTLAKSAHECGADYVRMARKRFSKVSKAG